MRIVFMGSSEASAMCLKGILREAQLQVVGVVTQPDRPAGRGRDLTPCPCKRYAVERGLKNFIAPDSVNSPEALAQIRAWKPDAIAVVAFGQFLKAELLSIPPKGCINCHFSLLPKYRGATPVTAAIAAGDKVTGVSVIRMGIGMDDGDVLLSAIEPISLDDTGGSLMERLAILGGVTIAKALKMIATRQKIVEIPQVDEEATYAHKLTKQDGLINWKQPSVDIERKIRAFNPWPGSFTFLPQRLRKKGQSGRLVVLGAVFAKISDEERAELPGTVLRIDPAGPVVRTGSSALTLVAVKPEGSRQMDGASFVNGRPLKPKVDMLADR